MRRLAFAVWLVVQCGSSFAYELFTHAWLTYKATQRSVVLSDPKFSARLGFDKYLVDPQTRSAPFGAEYIEMVGTTDGIWTANGLDDNGREFDWPVMPDFGSDFNPRRDNLTVFGWLMRGAIREDDDPGSGEPNPKDDAPSGPPIHRVLNHFFDPTNDSALTVGGIVWGKRAPDWATGYNASSLLNPQPDPSSENYFSLVKAREAMFRATTSLRRNSDGTFTLLTGPRDPAQEQIRKRYWATTFRALGDAVHLLQDMAQPQHTRNEPHAGIPTVQGISGHKSVLEAYADARMRGYIQFTVKNYSTFSDRIVAISSNGPILADYPTVPALNRYSLFFSTSPGSADRSGAGLADYSNRGFFTIGRNMGNSDYALPNPSYLAYSRSDEQLTDWSGAPLSSSIGSPTVTMFRGRVNDTLNATQSADGVAMSSYGGWDQFLQTYNGLNPQFSLNYVQYDDQIRLLLPRAISYSAGLIGYFFRGRMTISLPDEGVYAIADHYAAPTTPPTDPQSLGFGAIKLKVQNVTPTTDADGNPAIEPMTSAAGGIMVAVAKFHRNNCYASDLSGEYGAPGITVAACRSPDEEIVVSDPISVPQGIDSGPRPVTFSFPDKIPFSASDLFIQVVYRGPLGNEPDAVAVETKDISEPTYIFNFSTNDQFTYAPYPSRATGTYSYSEWCLQGYPTQDDCDKSEGKTVKFEYSPDGSYIPGFDPGTSSIPMDTWTDIQSEPIFQQQGKMVAPVGRLARVAVLLDAVPTNKGLVVREWINSVNGSGLFEWRSGTPVPVINQWIYGADGTGGLTPSVTYVPGRCGSDGKCTYVYSGDGIELNGGNATNIPPLQLVPSQICFLDSCAQ